MPAVCENLFSEEESEQGVHGFAAEMRALDRGEGEAHRDGCAPPPFVSDSGRLSARIGEGTESIGRGWDEDITIL